MTPTDICKLEFASGSMGLNVEAAAVFADNGGQLTDIGRLEDACTILEGKAGTLVTP